MPAMPRGLLTSWLIVTASACTADAPAARRPDQAVAVSPDVQAACDSAFARWGEVAGAELEHGDTMLYAGDLIADMSGDSVLDSILREGLPACHVAGTSPTGLDSAGQARLYWPAAGWANLWRLTADGPDGTVQTFQRGPVRCQVSGEWDGGDDSDTTYVPSPFFRERTICWGQARPLLPSDTAPGLRP